MADAASGPGNQKGFGFILLSDADNVVVARGRIERGTRFVLEQTDCLANTMIDIGFKIARTAIEEGSSIVKYGAPIGIATRAIAKGEVVHLHNMRSDYLATMSQPAGED